MDNITKKYFSNMARPIPGQGLLNDPENPYPWEKPPRFTDITRASEYIFETFIDEELYPDLIESLDNDVPIMDITRFMLFKGFTEGLWNPDLLLRLIEPTGYILLALAERCSIDPVFYTEEMEDEAIEEAENPTLFSEYKETKKIPAGKISKDIEEKIKDLPSPSLLAREE